MYHKIVTSMNKKYFDEGACYTLTSWDKKFPNKVEIHVYSEDLGNPRGFSTRVKFHNLHRECPEVLAFEKKHKNNEYYNGKKPSYNYRWDAIKFSNKIFPLFRFLKEHPNQKVYWIDCDVYCQTEFSVLELDRLMPNGKLVSYIGRFDTHSECGFVGYNTWQKETYDFVSLFESYYHANNLEKLEQTHDSYVFDIARKKFGKPTQFVDLNSTRTDDKNPVATSQIGQYLTHVKGDDKDRMIQKAMKRDRNQKAKLPTKTFISNIHRK